MEGYLFGSGEGRKSSETEGGHHYKFASTPRTQFSVLSGELEATPRELSAPLLISNHFHVSGGGTPPRRAECLDFEDFSKESDAVGAWKLGAEITKEAL